VGPPTSNDEFFQASTIVNAEKLRVFPGGLLHATGCMGMMALGHEDLDGQLRVAEQGGIQPLVRLLRIPRTSSQVVLAVVCALASLCIG